MNFTYRLPGKTFRWAILLTGLFSFLIAYAIVTVSVFACENLTVRDTAFQEKRDIHRLCLIAKTDDPQAVEMKNRLESWYMESQRDLNVELVQADPADPNISWSDYGIPSAPPSSPVVVLAGYHAYERKSFFIDYWEPGPDIKQLNELKTSPVRDILRRDLAEKIAVLIYIPGTNPETSTIEQTIDSVVRHWSKKEPLGVSAVRVDRSDESERLFLSFAGIKPTGPDWAAVAFGRGKLMPPLEGRNITAERLNGHIEFLLGDCSCLQRPASLGVDLPMRWNSFNDETVLAVRTGDIPPFIVGTQPTKVSFGTNVLISTLGTTGLLVAIVGVISAVIFRRKRITDSARV